MSDDATKGEICRRLIEGESLRTVCASEGMPCRMTVFRWLQADEAFRADYAMAREIQGDQLFEEIVAIADTPEIGAKITTKGDGSTVTEQGDMVEHRKLRVESRKWLAGRLAPKKYGDASLLKLADAEGAKLELSDTDRAIRLAAILASIEERTAK